MSDTVEYVLRAKDQITGTLKGVNAAAETLNETMKGIGEAVAAYFAFEQIKEFATESVNAFREQEQALAQVTQGLKTMGDVSGQTRESLEKWADKKEFASLYDAPTLLRDVSSVMLTFGNIAGENFTKAQDAVVDLSARMGEDLKSASVQLGKALNDPITGMTALRRVGVSFSDDQQKVIKTLTETGHLAQAQTLILDELNKEFGGSAQAAYDALDPMQKMSKEVEKMHEEVGSLIVQLQAHLVPVFKAMIEGTRELVRWIKENKDVLKALAITVAALSAVWIAHTIYVNAAYIAYTVGIVAVNAMTAAQWLLNAAMDANPIGIVVVALAAFSGAIWYAYKHSETFRAVISGIGAVMKGLWPILKGTGELIMGIFSRDGSLIQKGLSDFAAGIQNVGRTGAIFSAGYNQSLAESQATVKNTTVGENAKAPGKGGTADAGSATGKVQGASSSVTGTKTTTINITINKLVDSIKITSSNLDEATNEIQEKVARALLASLADAQRIAD